MLRWGEWYFYRNGDKPNGQFQLIVPDSLSHLSVKLSHVGYESSEYQISALNGKHIDFYLEPKIIPLQGSHCAGCKSHVQVLNRMIENRKLNYSSVRFT